MKSVGSFLEVGDRFVDLTIEESRQCGYPIEDTRHGRQINFGHKKLHEQHLRDLYPTIIQPKAHIKRLIENVAPGRSCTHKPMRGIVHRLIEAGQL